MPQASCSLFVVHQSTVVGCQSFIDESSSVMVCIGGGGVKVVVVKAGGDAQ